MGTEQQSQQEMADKINAVLGMHAPVPGTRANGWFGGYGCRWCEASRAWFTVLPFSDRLLADEVAALLEAGGCRSVTVTNEGGVDESAGGRGLQVSAYV